jgi:hypothetical protein
MNQGEENSIHNFRGKSKSTRKRHMEDLSVDGRIIFKIILREISAGVWTEQIG